MIKLGPIFIKSGKQKCNTKGPALESRKFYLSLMLLIKGTPSSHIDMNTQQIGKPFRAREFRIQKMHWLAAAKQATIQQLWS